MNTQSTFGARNAYFQTMYAQVLRRALVTEAICRTDQRDQNTIQNPYGSQPTATVQAVAGTYSVSAWTVTDDALTVTDEVTYAEHVYRHDELFAVMDIAESRIDEMIFAVAAGVDKFVLNALCEDATGSYSTPAGGFAAANIITILSNLLSQVAGYSQTYNGLFLVIENTDLPGFIQAMAANGFSMADAALKNGFMDSYMGIDIYVTRSGTFVDATIGTITVTNSGHRVFGVKNMATYASPGGAEYDEKKVTGKTGREINVNQLVGFKAWAQIAALIVDVTVTA
jgi:hypothetical protein